MKAMRNPAVVGILAAVALGMVGYNVIWPMLGGKLWRRAPSRASAPAASAPVASQPAASPLAQVKDALDQIMGAGKEAAPRPKLDVAALQANAGRWMQAPRRDPFLSRHASNSRAEQMLKLKAVWRQTGSNLAVINGKVLSEGDPILEFTVEKIEPDHVWVTGPNGREPLVFNVPRPETVAAVDRAQPTLTLESVQP